MMTEGERINHRSLQLGGIASRPTTNYSPKLKIDLRRRNNPSELETAVMHSSQELDDFSHAQLQTDKTEGLSGSVSSRIK